MGFFLLVSSGNSLKGNFPENSGFQVMAKNAVSQLDSNTSLREMCPNT